MRSGIRDHGLFILTENILNVSRGRRTIVLDKREDRQMGWAKRTRWEEERKEGKDKRWAHDRIESEEWRGILDSSEYESRNRSETTFGAHAIVPPGPENICNPFSRANFPLIPILSCQKSTLIPLLSPSPPGITFSPGKTSACPESAIMPTCVRRAHAILRGHAEGAKRISLERKARRYASWRFL